MPTISARALYEAPVLSHEQLPHHFTDRAALLLLVKMLWPRDAARQLQAFRRMCLPYQALFEKCLAVTADPLTHQVLDTNWIILGGWEGIADLPSKREIDSEVAQNAVKGRNAGAALFFMHCLHTHHAPQLQKILSLNNVWAWMERHGELLLGHPAKKDQLDDDWEHFRDVAHLWAAEFLLNAMGSSVPPSHSLKAAFAEAVSGDLDQDLLDMIQQLDAINHEMQHLLSYATHFQSFGLAYTAKHARKPLLNRDSMLLMEEVPEWRILLPRISLSDDLIASFNAVPEPPRGSRMTAGQP